MSVVAVNMTSDFNVRHTTTLCLLVLRTPLGCILRRCSSLNCDHKSLSSFQSMSAVLQTAGGDTWLVQCATPVSCLASSVCV